ncbi:MAG: hypothetical protein A2418_00495 [Candidatus Brennerbacteria bacterium RIFOXYC1_FULL_41_11]|uniref:Uncharacterized protein n=1 Tax=Candidatus Brennerbacteria bacterium RIFOXYD1_FULL_41_16 TaxID=1797529 RepID=A0A1G1XK03_9BACT|nr:MAG: hypothetical protein UU61_C0031G0008 [Parcubacteria group bacterium GW2011_GWB1_41_4]OGY39311.1 MAG: hypothetical protein A2391_01955 [Candidatus Brennerbacteria bacterium RIFOXYB1_FULL_41_13]OGY39714.1 MAG: hypothetical protein A2418_00495 [Candidatus Brennerbacteria bacterium RIFOXYC1_FULL_41_11]OGY40338.1 MAG: hypothetical protein A2570_03620 [Candidatus Brennerbacteria bacterium RIFOXYD1_FULL_41_16]
MQRNRVLVADRYFSLPWVAVDMIFVSAGGKMYKAYRVLEVGPMKRENGECIYAAPKLEEIRLDPEKHRGWKPGRMAARWAIVAAFRYEGYGSVVMANKCRI